MSVAEHEPCWQQLNGLILKCQSGAYEDSSQGPSIYFFCREAGNSGHRLVSQITGSADSSVDSVDVLTLLLTVGFWLSGSKGRFWKDADSSKSRRLLNSREELSVRSL